MGRRVYLHIGTMKSATSYLGQLCELNLDHLAASGLLWPKEGLRYNAIRDFFGRTVRETDFTGSWALLGRQMREFPGDVLVANEMLAAINARKMARLVNAFPDAEVQVIVTARDLARVIPSHWQTTLKNGNTETWRNFASAVCADPPSTGTTTSDGAEGEEDAWSTGPGTHEWFWLRHDVAAILTRWASVVPPERLTLVTVPPPGNDVELVATRYGSVLGVDLSGLLQPEWSNPSLGAHSAELMRRLNLEMTELSPAERSFGVRGALAGSLLMARLDKEPKYALTQAQQDWVVQRAETMIAQLRESGVRVVGDLADLIPARQAPSGSVDPEESSEAELMRAASHGLLGMVKAYTELRQEACESVHELEAVEASHDRLLARVERQHKRIDTLISARDAKWRRGPTIRLRSLLRRSEAARRLVQRLRGRSGTDAR